MWDHKSQAHSILIQRACIITHQMQLKMGKLLLPESWVHMTNIVLELLSATKKRTSYARLPVVIFNSNTIAQYHMHSTVSVCVYQA